MNVLTRKVRFPASGDVKHFWCEVAVKSTQEKVTKAFCKILPSFSWSWWRPCWNLIFLTLVYFFSLFFSSVKGEGKDIIIRSERGVKSASAAWGIIFTTPGWGWRWPSPKTFWLVLLGVEQFPVLSSSYKARPLYLSGCLLWWVAQTGCQGEDLCYWFQQEKRGSPSHLGNKTSPPRPSQPCWALVNSGSVTVLALNSGRKYTEKNTLFRQTNAHSRNCSNPMHLQMRKKNPYLYDKMCFYFKTIKGCKQSLSCSVSVSLMLGCEVS